MKYYFLLLCFCFLFQTTNAQDSDNTKAIKFGSILKLGEHGLPYNMNFDFSLIANNSIEIEQVFRLQTGYWVKNILKTELINGNEVVIEGSLQTFFDAGFSYLVLKKYFNNDKIALKAGGIGTSLYHYDQFTPKTSGDFPVEINSIALKIGLVSNNRFEINDNLFMDFEVGYYITELNFNTTNTANPILSVVERGVSTTNFEILNRNAAFITLGIGSYL